MLLTMFRACAFAGRRHAVSAPLGALLFQRPQLKANPPQTGRFPGPLLLLMKVT